MIVTFCNAADITVALHVYTTTISRSSTDNTDSESSYRPIIYVHNIRAEGVTLHVAVTRARQTATGCAKTNNIHVLSAHSSTLYVSALQVSHVARGHANSQSDFNI